MRMKLSERIKKQVIENTADTCVLNYPIAIEKTLKDVYQMISHLPPEKQKIVWNYTSTVLHLELWDTYPTNMRDNENWNKAFQKRVKKYQVLIIELNNQPKTKGGEITSPNTN